MDTKTFVNLLAERTNRDPQEIALLVKSLAEVVGESARQGDSVSVPGFGIFETRMRAERVTTHPSSGKRILVPPKLSLVFKPSAILKQKIRKQ